MNYHLKNKKGWMNNPFGVVHFNNRYHAYFQYYPFAARWGQMHIGHAVSDDLIKWKEEAFVLAPEGEFEDGEGCLSGSTIIKDNKMYLFYSSCSNERNQTVSVAMSEDGYSFSRYESNPIIVAPESCDNRCFRNPKVFEHDGKYKMIVGAGCMNVGKIEVFESDDLLSWNHLGEVMSDIRFGSCVESPDIFEKDGKYVLMFSTVKALPHHVNFAVGKFDGRNFIADEIKGEKYFAIETGPDFYAPQSFSTVDGRRVVMAWMFNWSRMTGEGRDAVGACTIPREACFDSQGRLTLLPIKEICSSAKKESTFVSYDDGLLSIRFNNHTILQRPYAYEPNLLTVEDVGVVEVFINGGTENITAYLF